MKLLPLNAALAIAATLVLASTAGAQTVTVNRCTAAKVRCVMGYTHVCGVQGVEGLFKCYQTATTKGRFVDQVCVTRTTDKLIECFRDAERLIGGCQTTGDVLAIDAKIKAFVTDVVEDVTPGFPYPVVNMCAVGKQKTASEGTSEKLECFEDAMRRSPGIVEPSCFVRADEHYYYAWAKLEGNGGCGTIGDADPVMAKIESFVADMIVSLDP